jgi:hypothetical protein
MGAEPSLDPPGPGLNQPGSALRRRSRRTSWPSLRVSRLLRYAPAAAPVSSGPSENALRPALAASRLRNCRASGDPVARTSPPGIMNTPRRCAHAAT